MTKEEFLRELAERLSCLPLENPEERLSFYGEAIDDRMEDGIAEEEAVAELGSIDTVTAQILADLPLNQIVKGKMQTKRRLRGWEIALIVLGSPLWIAVLAAVLCVILAVYVSLWSAAAALWATEIACAAGSLCCIFGSAVFFCIGNNVLSAVAVIATGIFAAGLCIFLFFGCKEVTKGIAAASKWIVLKIKVLLIGKERAK